MDYNDIVFEWIEIVEFKLGGRTFVSLWYEEEDMGFLKDGTSLLNFSSAEEANNFVRENLRVENPLSIVDFNIDQLKPGLLMGLEKLDREKVLDFWNIVIDLSQSLNIEFKGSIKNDRYNSLYNKMFFSSNLMGIDELKEESEDLSKEDLGLLREVLEEAIAIVEKVYS